MKHYLPNSLRALFLSLAVLLPLPMLAVEVLINGIRYDLDEEAKQATVIARSTGKYSGEIVIPKSVERKGTAYSVTSIGESAFDECRSLTSVTIPNSVKSIEGQAFHLCTGLTSVTIPNSVTSIGAGAFNGCSGLTSVHISDIAAWCNIDFADSSSNPLYYAHHLYLNGEEVKDLVIPNSVTSIGRYAFNHCSGLASVTIPNSVKSIGKQAFDACSGLTSIIVKEGNSVYDSRNNCNAIIETATSTLIAGCKQTVIPNSVTSIGDYAFSWCSGLTSVTIPNSVTSIGSHAFYNCDGLTSLTIPNSMESIGFAAFDACSGLTSVTIPNSVTSIGMAAFSSCENLTSVIIGNGVTSIGANAFWYCTGLTSVTIGSGVTSIGAKVFENCPLLDVYCYAEKVPATKSNAFEDSPIAKATLHVPAASIDSYKTTELWSGFGNIVAITTEVDGINYDFDSESKQATVIKKSSGEYSGKVVIPESVTHESTAYSVTSIGEGAFRSCSGLTSVTIGNSVTSIGDYAFYLCSGLSSVTIGNCVESIGEGAFNGCSGLTSVTIGNSVKSIGEWAFYKCSGLTSVTIPNSVTSIGMSAFFNCSGLTSVTIPNSVESIGIQAFKGCSDLTTVTIGNSVESIGEVAFANCSKLHDVYCYAEKVPSTSSNAFESSPIGTATLHVPAASINSYNATAPWSGFGKIVAISESTNDLVIKDGESFENTEERELGTLTYTRTLPNMLWNPLYAPFKIPYEALKDNYDVAYINTMHSYDNDQNGEIDKMTMEVILVKNGVLKANHPYLIRAKSDNAKKMELVLEDVTLYPTVSNMLDCSSVYTRFEITGTYEKMSRDDLNGSLVITTDGAWMELSESSELKPFRFYLTITDRPGSPLEVSKESKSRINICVQGEDDFSTGIEETENGKVKSENSAVYDLSGRRVQKAQKGVFIQNGKVMVK